MKTDDKLIDNELKKCKNAYRIKYVVKVIFNFSDVGIIDNGAGYNDSNEKPSCLNLLTSFIRHPIPV